jgi:hypothetical protein
MQLRRFLFIAVPGAFLVWLGLTSGIGARLEPLLETTAGSIENALRSGSPLPGAFETRPRTATERLEPAVAAFAEIEGDLFQILVGRDSEGEAWSAAVSDEK